MNYLKIYGNSFVKTYIHTDGVNNVVRKECNTIEYRDRLLNQINKQNYFNGFKNINSIKYNEFDKNSFIFDMNYNNGFDFSEYFQITKIDNIKTTITNLLDFIQFNFNNSYKKNVTSLVQDKYRSVKNNIINLFGVDYIDFSKLDAIFINEVYLSVGYCHGDLTLSNILFSRMTKSIYLIDFLDSYIESPLIDVVKLRQDTYFKWSYNFLYNKNTDINKLNIIMAYFDLEIQKKFCILDEYTSHYNTLQLLNFLRIIPYSTEATNTIIINNIKKIYEHINNPSRW